MYNPQDTDMSLELSEKVDAAISEGIWQAQMKQMHGRKLVRRRIGGLAAACLLFAACLFTIRVSPVFAAMVRDIPGFERFVDLISHNMDKGIQLAVDHDFVQPVQVSDEHDGVKLTVQGIIADDARMVMFYEIELPDQVKGTTVQLDQPSLLDASGQPLLASIGFNYPDEAKQDDFSSGIQRGTADFHLAKDAVFPDEVTFQVNLIRPEPSLSSERAKSLQAGTDDSFELDLARDEGTKYELRIPIDQAKFAGLRQEYDINQTIQVEGQAVSFTKAVVSPLHVSLYMDYGADNTKQIFGAGDIWLVDDEGRIWNNTSASVTKDHPVYNFESPYFIKPSSLHVEGTWFRALDKDQMTVKVNTETKQVLEAPDDKIALHDVTSTNEYTKLDFAISGLDAEDHMMYSLFENGFVDAGGQNYNEAALKGETVSGYSSSSQPDVQHDLFYIENKAYQQPLTFTIYSYPGYIRQPYDIRIK
ncbi:DUF4179 domain-containing protein [Paenibacillus hexagrammi]|uniref:DUF4179 domain-containing protein n=1 Tax=Paenibacillus hexagrammi TaxID=2908839 RepID=A0ABY3SM47_9BACL|nr:DUF5643 domain-containing protein [Paenibacillus sp. YPD9-1]UJF34195.1 DUF4179 domain-containing protein [Paenibacillus sp. YPD9-1]